MASKQYFIQGISMVELILVIALVAILGLSVAPFSSRFILKSNHEAAATMLLSALEKAQQYAIMGKNNSQWGVCLLNETTLRLYQNTCADPPFSEDQTIPGNVSLSGLTDITFSKRRGEPLSTATISISSSLSTTTVSVNAAGLID